MGWLISIKIGGTLIPWSIRDKITTLGAFVVVGQLGLGSCLLGYSFRCLPVLMLAQFGEVLVHLEPADP